MVTENTRKTVLKVEHVAKSFRLPTEQASGVKQLVINWTKGIKGYRDQEVLHDISFEVKQGDFFGIVGRNGSGKSTLLKLISGIYVPDKGTIQVDGKLVPFIELGVGFNPELTGRENVYLNGALLGFSTDEIDAMYDDIVTFAELGDFMDQKLKNYSSGMQVRLAFSLAIRARGDILVLDEVLAVGDEAFQRKCDRFFDQIKDDPQKTVILVTHSMDAVKKYCNNAILIKDGDIIVSGDKDDVADRYTLENLATPALESQDTAYEVGLSSMVPALSIRPISPLVMDGTKPFEFEVEYHYEGDGPFFLAIEMRDLQRSGVPFYSDDIEVDARGHVARLSLPLNCFNQGQYHIKAYARTLIEGSTNGGTEATAFTNDQKSCTFVIRNKELKQYALLNDATMRIQHLKSLDC